MKKTNEPENEGWYKKYKINGVLVVAMFAVFFVWNVGMQSQIDSGVGPHDHVDYITMDDLDKVLTVSSVLADNVKIDLGELIDSEEAITWECIRWYGSCGEMILNEDTRIMAPYGYFNQEECVGTCADYTLHKRAVLPTITKTEGDNFELKLPNGTIINIVGVNSSGDE